MTSFLDISEMIDSLSSLVQPQIPLRAAVQAARIADKPTSIILFRNGSSLDAQVVRIEFDDTYPSENDSASGVGFGRRGVIFGYQGYPSLADLDVKLWDTFVLGNEEFTITSVNKNLTGQIQCRFEAVGS